MSKSATHGLLAILCACIFLWAPLPTTMALFSLEGFSLFVLGVVGVIEFLRFLDGDEKET